MYILAIVLMFVLPIDHGHSVSQNRNILDAYSDNVSWFECPRGWKKFGRKCLLPVTAQISWRYAETICKRFGSTLWVTDSYNYNKKVGEILRTLTSNLDSPDSNLPPLIWIGLMCNSSCSEMDWAGFWTPGQTFLFNQNVDSCAQLNIAETTAYGDYRWTLEDCFTQTWFVCQTDACISGQFHCLTDNKCISNYWVCDGKPDCPDGSDEINCAAPCYFKFTNSSGMFGSPNYPMNYEPFSYCQWLIQTPLGTKVQLQFESFDIEKYDFVEVRDGGNPAALLLGKYTGKAEFEVPLSSSSLLLVILKTDHSYQKQGFQAVWHAVKLQDCGATLTSSEEKQWLTSPRYPGFYPNSVVCDWIITSGNKNDIVTLQFTDFRLSQNDWLEVRDGNSSGSKLHKRLEGKNMPDVIISVGPSFFLRFFTDSAFRGKGFNMTYVSGCHIVVTNIPATFESPGRGRENYPNRINCSWHVQDEKKRNMTLVFDSKFDTEVDADIVQVYNSEDGKEESLLGSFSGTKVPPLLTSSTGQFKVTFVSDELLRKTGWNASVSFGFDCGFPGLPEHTSLVHITGTTAGAVAKYKCWTGYRADRLTSVCRNNVWDPLPICTMIVCEITSNITNGKVYYDTPSRYGSTIYYNCCYGFHPVGFTRATCLETGNWSSPPPICKENLCLSSVHVLNSNSTVKGPVLAGYSVNILCDPGYQLSNSTGRITCMTSGVYHISASCTDIDECENSSLNSCGIHMCENLPGKYICKCLKGYRHDSEEMRFCVDIDECLENNGKCEQKCTNLKGSYFCYCDDKYYLYNNTETGVIGKKLLIPKHSCINTCSPLHIANGKVFYSMQSFNNLYLSSTVAYVECPKGYVADGSTWTTCTSSGSWSFLVTHCTVAECLSVQPPQHGNVSYSNGLLYGSTASYTCTKGYILVGNRIRYCENAHGHGLNRSIVQWTGTKPSCEIAECGEPPPLTNGHVTHGKTVVNSWSSYSCMCGYKLVGSGYRTCQTSGLWSKNSIQCIPIYCPKPQKPFFGSIKNETQKKFPVGSTIHFLCDKPGFKLSGPPILQCVFSKVPIHSKIIRYSLTLRTRFRTVTPASSMCLNLTSSQYRQMLEPLLTADIDTACNHSLYMELTLSERHPHLDSSQIVLEMNITFLAANSQEKQLRICNCAENVVPTVMSKVQGYMELVTSLSCPAVDVQSVTMEKVQHLWQCPKGFTVPKIGLTCLDADPKCVQECPSVKELILAAPNLHINKAKVFSTPSSSHVFSDSSPGPMEFRGVFTTTMPGITLLQRRNYAIACLTYNLTIITSDAVLMKCSAEMQNLLSQRLVSMQENLKLLLPLLPYCNMKGLQMKLQLKHGIDPHHAALAFDIKLLLPLDAAGKKKLYNCSGELSKFVKINLGEDSSLDRRNLFICSNLRGLSTHLFQLNSNNRHQHIRKRETSHIAADSFPDAQWSEETPRCADVQDPVFHDCNNITINHSISGVEPTILAVPRVTDNSGEEPCVTSTPADLHLLVDVKKNTSVLFQAVDASGNKAFCHLNIFINDTVPPRIICPSAVVSIGYQSDRNVQITYKTVELIATDNVQIDYITFKPPNGTVIKADSFVQVMATAVDVSGNSASCYFTYKAYTSGCPHTLLATPENGTKSCTNMTNNNITEHRCRLYCNINHDIVQWHDQSYICYGNGDWNPKFPVLDCAMQQAPDYWMKVKLTFYRKDISNMFPCMSVFMKAIMANRNKFIINSCFNLTGQLAIITEFDKSFQFDKNKLFTVANVRIVVVAATPVSLHHFKNCLSLIMETTNARNVTLQTDRCGEISLIPPIVKTNENFSCLAGKTMKGEYCLQCTPGSHANVTTGKCQVCPVGTFQDKSGQLSCIPCPNGTTTDSILSKNISQCLSTCQAGEFSDNGLIPCRKCPLGFFQSRRQSLQCLVCPVNMSTPEVGATSVNNCSVVCLPGTFSYTGVAPCFDCPLHTHAAGFGSISCTEHPGSAARSGRYQKPDCVGYDDHFCPAETDHCLSDSCVHGVCIEEEHSYSCECYTGFEGNRCEKDIDDCFHQPCQNKGVCIDLVGTFYCHCTGTGYEGNLCELDVDDCLQNICLNGGNCTDSINNFHCACPEDFTGTHCEKNIDECLSSPCLHDGLCLDQVNGYYCFCKPGYVGKNCEVGIDVCLPNPCLNNGKCLSIVTDFICHCNKGHTGKICETDIDDCNQFSCHFNNTLQCLDGVDSYKCLCKPGWTGVRCDTDINECLSNPCQYVNECRNLHNGFECGCLPGYTGLTCSVDIEECLSFPCQNNGTCIDKINDVECVCLPDFTGKHCEHYIDHCQRMKYACKNNSTCTNLGLNFECLCLPGWTGKYCAENVDECISIPCLNGGSCSDLLDSYECTCLKGFAGENCEQDTQHQYCNNNGNYTLNNEKHYCMCLEGFTGETCSELVDSCSSLNNICPNGTTCVIDSEGKFCMKDENEASMCPPMFEGYDCNKRSTDNYDLLLKAGSTCKLPEYNTANLNEFSVCFWVRVLGPQLSQTFLSLTGTGNESVDGSWKSREVVFEFQENQILISSFQKIVVPVNLSAGLWQQFCFLWSGTPLKPCIIMVDGNVTDSRTFGKRKLQLNSLQVFLEWKESQLQDTRIEISQFNMYSHMLSKTQVKHLAQNCTGKLAGDIVSWNQLKICQHAAVDVREPSACGNNSCPPGYTGMFCKTIIDVTPPEVLYCPENLKQISPENRLVVTKWVEPVFVDDRGVVEIKQTHRVGQIFSYGEYFISYVAYDANNNSASCSFMLYILPSDCMLPTATSNGELRCKEEKHGIFCKPRCADCMDFFQDVPAFYRCDQAGIWDPPLQNTFRSLPCAPVELPDHHVKGSLIFKSSDKNCSPERKAELKNSFVNFTHRMFAATSASNIKLVCSSSVYRKKRSTELNQFYKLSFNFLSNDSSSPDHFETALKKGRLNTFNFTAISKSLDVVTTLHCQAGMILTKTDKCVPCGAGTYYNLTSSKCEPCPVGMYNEERKQFKCVHCKTGHTTDTIGAISKQDCYMMCLPGEAFNNESKKCELCPLGYYQDKVGELYCKSCPNGKTTLSVGAASLRNCSKNCPLGKELYVTNECIPCIKGTYRDQLEDSACKVCPFGYTTVEEGAVSLNQCSVVHCNSGYYRNHTSVCRPCPRGTYQPQRNKISCLRCMKGLTTLYPATKSIADCISGNINQCISGFHNCHEHANCMNINGDILCVCQDGFQGNGIVCEDICTNFCLRGSCMKVDGNPYCKCPKDYKGMLCENKIGPAMEVIIGGVVGGVILIIISFFFIFKCVYRKKHQQVTKSDIYHRTEIYNLSKGVYFPNKTFELPVNDVAHPIPEELPPPDDPRYWRTLEIAEVHA